MKDFFKGEKANIETYRNIMMKTDLFLESLDYIKR